MKRHGSNCGTFKYPFKTWVTWHQVKIIRGHEVQKDQNVTLGSGGAIHSRIDFREERGK